MHIGPAKQVWWHAFRRRVTTWEIDDRALGADRRKYRKKFGLSLRALAKEMGFSAPYLSDLELGRRAWNEQLIYRHEAALTKLAQAGGPLCVNCGIGFILPSGVCDHCDTKQAGGKVGA